MQNSMNISKFKILINSSGLIKESSNNISDLIKNLKINNLNQLLKYPLDFNKIKKIIELIKNQESYNKNQSISLKINNNVITYNFNIKKFNIIKDLYTIEFTKKNELSKHIEEISGKIDKKFYSKLQKNIYKLSQEISKDLALTNLFVININNKFSICEWNVRSEYLAHFINNKDILIINNLKKNIKYYLFSNKYIDSLIDKLFYDNINQYYYLNFSKQINDIILFLTNNQENLLHDLHNYINNHGFYYLAFIPIVIKNNRIGFFILFKESQFTNMEKIIINDIKQKSEKIINDKKFYNKYISILENINLLKNNFPDDLYKLLYESLIKINNTNNIFELKNVLCKEIKNITDSNYLSYFDIDWKDRVLIPYYIDEVSEIKSQIENKKIKIESLLCDIIFRIKKNIIINNDNQLLENYILSLYNIKDNLSFLISPLYLGEIEPVGIFILRKNEGKKFNNLDSAIINTIYSYSKIKYKEICLIKENIESKIRYKTLYETVLSLNSSNSFYTTLDIIAKITASLVSTDTVIIYKIDDDKKFLIPIYSNEKIEVRIHTMEEKIPLGKYLAGKCCEDGITRFLNIEDYDRELDSCPDKLPKSMMVIPLSINDNVIGAEVLIRYSHQNFNSNDLETILPFAQQSINIVYQNILQQKVVEQQEILKIIIETITALNNLNLLRDALEVIFKNFIKLVHSQRSFLYICDNNSEYFNLISNYDIKYKKNNEKKSQISFNNSFLGYSFKEEIKITYTKNEYFTKDELMLFEPDKYVIITIPIKNNNKNIGIIILEKIKEDMFNTNDLLKIKQSLNLIYPILFSGAIGKNLERDYNF